MQKEKHQIVDDKEEEEEQEEGFTAGAFIGEFGSIIKGISHQTKCISIVNSTAYKVEKKDFIGFLSKNPKLLIILSSLDHVE